MNIVGFLVLCLPPAAQDDVDKIHTAVARKVAPAVVFVADNRQSGSGVLIDKTGVVLTSTTAVGPSSTTVTVVTKGSKSWRGRVMGRSPDKELVLVKIDAGGELPFVELGDSDRVRVGQTSYVFGDSFGSMIGDDQPAMSMGSVSGIYRVTKTKGSSSYLGPVIETSAAVNPNQDGGPLVDKDGRLIGMVTLNYDESKFTGIAVPVNALKPEIERIRKEHETGIVAAPRKPAAPGWLGLEVQAVEGGLEVVRVSRNGPAEKAGVKKGDVLVKAEAARTLTRAALDKVLGQKAAGEPLRLVLRRGGEPMELAVTLAKRPEY
jgi:S1-C subfamily serine protease